MNRTIHVLRKAALLLSIPALVLAFGSGSVTAQKFDFDRLSESVRAYTVVVDVRIEFSFGMQSNEHEQRTLGTIVTEDGLVMFDGGYVSESNPLSPMSSFAMKSTPTNIEITTLDDEKLEAEYVGVDRNTRIAFARILNPDNKSFTPLKFVTDRKFKVGEWLAVHSLLPEFVSPPLGVDIGLVSTLVESPEPFPLVVGLSSADVTAALYDDHLNAVGVLGMLDDPGAADNGGGFMDAFGPMDLPLLGVITGERLNTLIANPPQKGKEDRAWLGITMQALTEDIAGFLGVDLSGGIIVNDVARESPAYACGMQIGDILYEINGQPITIDREEKLPIFQRQIAGMGAGTSVEFSTLRPVEDRMDTVKILAVLEGAPLAAADADEYENKALEFKVRDMVFADYMLFNVEQGSITGVIVTELQRGGLAFIGGLGLGDVIQRVDGFAIASVDDMAVAMEAIEAE
ncbi:MAG: PDZ domain-containing protein, partial [candidate division Zixibacteria bacterium]|nr:PDZ domain-containing protein [candidate division Zixibacteria bacterium]